MIRLRNLANRSTQNAWFAYTTILLLQLKVIWGIWKYRDLTFGDTSSYFVTAYDWFKNGRTVISWSPLYTSFYGSMLYLSPDAYVATTAHRMLIVLFLSVLVLALMRRLLPALVAWVVAAWWVVLPINFESLYEIHLFAIIPILAAYLTILSKPGPRMRGAAIGIIIGSALLIRNEHMLPAGLLAAIILVYEAWQVRKDTSAAYPAREYLWSYGLPLVIVGLLTLFFYSRAHDKIPALFDVMRVKHTLNICQVYAFGYQQRHPEWNKSPWTECEPLMTSTFGKPQLPLTEAVMRNPRAMTEHFLWNISLIPNGLQVLLFNATSGTVSPDYTRVVTGSKFALLCSIMLIAIYSVGSYKLYREWRYWWTHWLQPRVWGWIAMACPTLMVLFIMITQRPRPSYLFSFGLFMMAVGGFCGYVISYRWSFYERLAKLFAILTGLIILFLPPYYHDTAQTNAQPLSKFYRTLAPFQDIMRVPGTVLLTAGYSSELCNYLGLGSQNCNAFFYWDLRSQVKDDADWLSVLEKHGINLFFVDESVFADPQKPKFISDPKAYGWETIGFQNGAGGRWILLQRPKR